MAFLEIVHLSGDVERRELSKQSPLSIGSHRSNDVRVDDEGVEIMHCRIGWNKTGYEAVSAGLSGLDINGTMMQRKLLEPGDVLRVGSIDFRFGTDEAGTTKPAEGASSEYELNPISEEIDAYKIPAPSESKPKAKPKKEAPPAAKQKSTGSRRDRPANGGSSAKEKKRAEKPSRRSEKVELPDDGPPDDVLAELAKESRRSRKEPAPAAEPPLDDDRIDDGDVGEKGDTGPAEDDSAGRTKEVKKESPELKPSPFRAVRQQHRPGEEDILRSPLLITLGAIAAGLLLTGAIFYFIAGRQTTQAEFDEAKLAYDEGNFLKAIPDFETFLLIHPRDPLAVEAKQLLGLARVRRNVEGASPNYDEGLKQLRLFVNEQRDLEAFESLHPMIADQAKAISLGAAALAGKSFEPALLEVSREARTILKTYAPKEAPPTETLQQIEATLRASEAAILKDDVYKEHIAAMEALLTETPRPLEVFQIRRDLLTRYAGFERDRQVQKLVQDALTALRDAVTFSEVNREALTEDRKGSAETLTLLFHGQTRTDEVPVGRAVYAVAKDCCYGLDAVTGAPVWRRRIGTEPTFFPVSHPSTRGLILFETEHEELLRVNQDTGELVWRQPLGGTPLGEPLVTDDTVYVTTDAGTLLAVDVETGELAGQLQFPQPITAPVLLQGGSDLLVVGQEEVVYRLSRRPLRCKTVSYLGQPANSVRAPLVAMGGYVLAIENGTPNSTLRLLDTRPDDEKVVEAATGTVAGRVFEPPVIRGRDLFVPSTNERITAFSVSDDPGEPPLTAGPVYEGSSSERGPIHLLAGPDRQLWMNSSYLSRLRLTTEALQADSEPVALGVSAQPLQYLSGYLYNARRRPYSDAVILTRTDRDQLVSDWQAVLGARPIAWTLGTQDASTIACLNEAGQVFRIGDRQWSEGPFLTTAATRLPLHNELVDPLLAASLPNQRIAVVCGEPEPRLWVLNRAGQTEGSPRLSHVPQAPPTLIGDRIVIPLEGRLHVPRLSGQSPVIDFTLPTGEDRFWLAVERVGEDRGVAVTADGLVLLLKMQTSPRAFLDEVARVEAEDAILVSPIVSEEFIAISTASGKVTLFDVARLEPIASREFGSEIIGDGWAEGDALYVQTAEAELHALDPTSGLPSRWTHDLGGSLAAGLMAEDGMLILVRQDGVIERLDPGSGETVEVADIGFEVAMGPVWAGDRLVIATLDGTLVDLKTIEWGQP